jgi:peptidoglycan/xylan/chitin deacetylase (PgdA/CDA1 family)
MPIASRAVRRLLFTAGNTKVFWPLMRSRATILMLHRFRASELGVEGHDPQTLRRALEALRRERFEILPLTTLFEDLTAGRRHKRPAVAFTIDDGYLDHATVAAPIFAEFDCPVTTFVTTGFLDAQLWFWWDRIEYVFESTKVDSLSVDVGGHAVRYAWRNDTDRLIAQNQFTTLCKELMDSDKNHAIERLALASRVDIPALPPLRYAPMTWSDLRRCERMTMSFGAHTVTHPVLSRTSDAQARFELAESWRRLRMEATNPVPVWCYPNGQAGDFGEREMAILRELGFIGAVTGMTGYADAAAIRADEIERFRVRRFPYPDSLDELLLLAGGAERLKQIVRREA